MPFHRRFCSLGHVYLRIDPHKICMKYYKIRIFALVCCAIDLLFI